MINRSKHKLNFFENLTDPMRFGFKTNPPKKIANFIWFYCSQIKFTLWAVFLLKFVEVLMDLAVPIIFGYIVSRIIEVGDVQLIIKEEFTFLVGFGLFFLIVRPSLQSLSQALMDMAIMTGFANIVRWQSHLNVLGLDVGYFSNELSGRLANRVIETGQAVRGVAMKFLEAILYITLYFGGTIFVLGYSSLAMTLPSLIWLAIFLVILLILMPKVRDLSHKHSLLRSKMTGRIVDSYANINLVKLFARKNYEQLGEADSFDDFNFAFQAVICGDADASIIDETAGLGYMGANKDQVKFVGGDLTSEQLGFAFPNGSPLVDVVNQGLAAMEKSGKLAEINAKFFSPDFSVTYDDIAECDEDIPAEYLPEDCDV